MFKITSFVLYVALIIAICVGAIFGLKSSMADPINVTPALPPTPEASLPVSKQTSFGLLTCRAPGELASAALAAGGSKYWSAYVFRNGMVQDEGTVELWIADNKFWIVFGFYTEPGSGEIDCESGTDGLAMPQLPPEHTGMPCATFSDILSGLREKYKEAVLFTGMIKGAPDMIFAITANHESWTLATGLRMPQLNGAYCGSSPSSGYILPLQQRKMGQAI